MKWAGPTPMPHKGLAEVAPPGVFEVRPWASHALKSRGANVAGGLLQAFLSLSACRSPQPRGRVPRRVDGGSEVCYPSAH
jgi:hypothetical protein